MKLVEKILSEARGEHEKYSEKVIQYTAWLYFITYPYDGVLLKDKGWAKDKRMGVTCEEAMEYYSDIVSSDDESYKVTDLQKAKEIVHKVFGKIDSYEDDYESELKKYDIKGPYGYKISHIPNEIFGYENENANEFEQTNLSSSNYLLIKKWYEKYQRHYTNWLPQFNSWCGEVGDLVKNKTYTLYRGIWIEDKTITLKPGDTFADSRISWTLHPLVAEDFSKGKTNWMDSRKMKKGQTAIILKHSFQPSEVFLDTEFVDSFHPILKGMVDFPQEKEVLIRPVRNKKYTIWKIFYE